MNHQFADVWVEIRPSKILPGEVGLHAAKPIHKGEKIPILGEEPERFITTEEFKTLPPVIQNKILMFTFGRPGGYSVGLATNFNALPTYYYMNHSCDGNVGFDEDGDFTATRDIEAGDELFYDYALVEAHPDFTLHCLCNTPTCRKVIRGIDWQDEGWRSKNWAHLHPDIKALARA